MKKVKSIKSILMNSGGYSLLIALLSIIVISILGISIYSISSSTLSAASKETLIKPNYYIAESALVETQARIDYAVKLTTEEFANNKEYCKLNKDNQSLIFSDYYTSLRAKLLTLGVYLDDVEFRPLVTKDFLEIKNNNPIATYKVTTNNQGLKLYFNIDTTGKVASGSSDSIANSSTSLDYVLPCSDGNGQEELNPPGTGTGFTPEVALYTETLKTQGKASVESYLLEIPKIQEADSTMFDSVTSFNGSNISLKNIINSYSTFTGNSNTFTLYLNNPVTNLFVRNLDLSKVHNFEIKGTGSLNIYVLEHIQLPKKGIGKDSKLTIIYQGTDKIVIPSQLQYYGNLFAHNSEVQLGSSGGGNPTIHTKTSGSIGDGCRNGNVTFTGSIIANSYYGWNTTSLCFNKITHYPYTEN